MNKFIEDDRRFPIDRGTRLIVPIADYELFQTRSVTHHVMLSEAKHPLPIAGDPSPSLRSG